MTLAAAQQAPQTAPLARSVLDTLRANWRIYAIEAALLGTFMLSACSFTVALEHPGSLIRQSIDSTLIRRTLMGLAMAATALCLIYSPWGRRSGPHMNPAMTLSFLRLGRINIADACFYIAGQFIGATVGVFVMSLAVRMLVSHPSVMYAATRPGKSLFAAWVAEFCIAFITMSVVMASNKRPRLAPFTGCLAAALVATYITFEAPFSGMSLNPARSFGSAVFAHTLDTIWLYLTAPVAGMFAGIELHRALTSEHHRLCGKLTHSRTVECFIPCNCLKEGNR